MILKTNFVVIIAKVKLWLDKVIKIQCLETFEVMIINNYKTLRYSPGIAPEQLSDHCWDVWRHMLNMMCTSRRCPMTSHTILVPALSSFLPLFLLLHFPQAKCLIYCLTLNPVHGIILMKNARIRKKKESVACKQNKTPLYFQLHTPRYVRRFKREQMPFILSFRRFFNLKVWFLRLCINPPSCVFTNKRI